MLDLTKIPDITFYSSSGTRTLSLAASLDRIAARTELLRGQFCCGGRIGIINQTGPDLVIDWLSALAAGLVPTILHYPTAKQNRQLWAASISHLAETCGLVGILAQSGITLPGLPAQCRVIRPEDDASGERHPGAITAISSGSVIQMSSGTTGHRKPIAYSLSDIARHVACYNGKMKMSGDDVVVSWLPLYHDMGFIACFMMPMLTGARLVLIDPMEWVQNPGLLWTALERFDGTICYMPNFGFEVMARSAGRHRVSSMRKWVSCAEPVAAGTVRRFLNAIGTDDAAFSACYAMAENVFAISQSDGFQTVEVDDRTVVSCGEPIHGTLVKIVDGEICIRSSTSLTAYVDGPDITDSDGFFPTGDFGALTERGLVVLGRKRDILIQAGTKHFLSDFDLTLNELFPDVRGRACSLAAWSEREGTEHPLFLVERRQFFDRSDLPQMIKKLRSAINIAHFELATVPPFFLTKTSSGKINRRETLRRWEAVQTRRSGDPGYGAVGLRSELMRYFSAFPTDVAVGELLDSLGTTILQMILSDHGAVYDESATLRELLSERGAPANHTAELVPCVNIVSCADGRQWRWMDDTTLRDLEAVVGCPVHFEHICAPPVPALLSDLIFAEYFLPENPVAEYAVVINLLGKIRRASMVIFDDMAELGFGTGVFPVLSHRLERDPAADLFSFRWQRYSSHHDVLPITVIDTSPLGKSSREEGFRLLRQYLGVPIFRFAVMESHRDFTEDWEYREIISGNSLETQHCAAPELLRSALLSFVKENAASLPRTLGPAVSSYRNSDLPHFCCNYIERSTIDFLLDHYRSFAVIGPPQSVPYIRHRAGQLTKPVNYIPHWNRNPMDGVLGLEECREECILLTGAWGDFRGSDKPIFQVMGAYPDWPPDNIPDDLAHLRYRFRGTPPANVGQSFYRYWNHT